MDALGGAGGQAGEVLNAAVREVFLLLQPFDLRQGPREVVAAIEGFRKLLAEEPDALHVGAILLAIQMPDFGLARRRRNR